ncbi:MAG: kynureninase [Bacillota bacterium]
MEYKPGENFAHKLDEENKLLGYKEEFYLNPNTIYLDGNSLGLLSRQAEIRLLQALDEWKKQGVEGWTEANPSWFWYGERLGELTAPLIGAEETETIVTGSTTLNIHHLLATLYRPEGKKKKIVVDELNFPSDIYAVKSQLALHGQDPKEDLVVVKSRDGETLKEEDIINHFTEDVAVVFLPSVLYRSGQLLDIARLTEAAHSQGIIIGFDLAHSIGILPHTLSDIGVDFALWCNYKYLNGGPGAVGGLYLNQKHFQKEPALAGWWGHDKESQFDMSHEFTPADTAGAWQISTIPILSSAPLFGALTMITEIGIENIRTQSLKLTDYLMYLLEDKLSRADLEFTITTPRPPEKRGGHVAVKFEEEAYRINRALKAEEIIIDFREPDTIRFAPSPLYVSFTELYETVSALAKIIQEEEYKRFSDQKSSVT